MQGIWERNANIWQETSFPVSGWKQLSPTMNIL